MSRRNVGIHSVSSLLSSARLLSVRAHSRRSFAYHRIHDLACTIPQQHLVQVQILFQPVPASVELAASCVECSLSDSRLRAIRELGARQRSRRARRLPGAKLNNQPLADHGRRRTAPSLNIRSISTPPAHSARNSIRITHSLIWPKF